MKDEAYIVMTPHIAGKSPEALDATGEPLVSLVPGSLDATASFVRLAISTLHPKS